MCVFFPENCYFDLESLALVLPGTLDAYMRGGYPASLQNVSGSIQK